MPAHWWMPVPKARWRFGVRVMSNWSGLGNWVGSRLAAPMQRVMLVWGGDVDVGDGGDGCGHAVAELVAAFEAEDLFGGGAGEGGVGDEASFFDGMVEEGDETVADEVGGGFVAGV